VIATGTGPAVLFLPGLFGSAYEFRRVTPLFTSAGYRVIIVEPLGIGYSGRPPAADYSLTAQADRIAAVLDTFRVAPLLVVAHSLGGAMAFRLAVRRPDLVRGLVSIEGGPTEEATTPSFRRALKWAPLLRLLGGTGIVRGKIRGSLLASSGDRTWVTDEAVRGYTDGAVAHLGATLHAYQAMGRAREPELLAPRLAEIHCPVRLMVGGAPHDGGAGADEIALLRSTLKSFAVDSVPGAGHYIQEEQPGAVLRAVRRLEAGAEGGAIHTPAGGAGVFDARRAGR
jgi:pimeloyl-ACP methyl ester carboxylesterase